MKTLIAIFLIISISAHSQNVATLTLQAQDWAWLIGKNVHSINTDSASASEFRKIRDQVRTANPASFTTNVTLTNVPEWVVMAFYRTVKTSNAGEIVGRYTAITGAIEAKAQLISQITAFNTSLTADFERAKNTGKSILMDN